MKINEPRKLRTLTQEARTVFDLKEDIIWVLACTIPVLEKLNPKNLIHIILGGKKRKKRINSEAFTNSHEVSNPFAVKDERRFFFCKNLNTALFHTSLHRETFFKL